MDSEKPIGFWLKRLDRLIEETFDRVLAEDALARRHWQTLNVLRRSSPLPREAIQESLEPFWNDGAATLDEILADLADRGWIAPDEAARFSLTSSGVTAHTEVAERIEAVRRSALEGLTTADYDATVRVLRRMTETLARSLEAV